jgi:hypothetical protein
MKVLILPQLGRNGTLTMLKHTTKSWKLLADNIMTDTAESNSVSHRDPKHPDSLRENTAMLTVNSIQVISCLDTVEEGLILVLVGY